MSRTIAIVGGTGPQGTGLALRWARAGQHVIIGSRDENRARLAAQAVAERPAISGKVEGAENRAAVAAAQVVMLTIPFAAHADTLKHIAPALRPGSVVLDATVPLAAAVGGKPSRVLGVWQGSAAQQAAEILGKDIAVAAAFQNVSATLLNIDAAIDCDVIVCSDHERAKKTAFELVRLIPGLRALDGGKLENARIVEQITALLITLNIRHKAHATGIRVTGLTGIVE